MFKVDENRALITDLPIITGSRRDLLFNEVPILFTGTNRLGDNIIGSSVDEDYRIGVERYFHIIVDIESYSDYIRRKVTYRSLLAKAKPIYVVDKLIDANEYRIYQYLINEIPEDYLPVEDTYYPRIAYIPSHTYSANLKGGLADQNSAYPAQVAKTQNKGAAFLKAAFDSLKSILGIEPIIMLNPATSGSFTINYNVEIKETRGNLYRVDYFKYLNEFIAYCLNNLPNEINTLLDYNFQRLPDFNKLFEVYCELNPVLDQSRQHELQENFARSVYGVSNILSALAEDVGDSYDKIAIINDPFEGNNILGVISESYKQQIDDVVLLIEEKKGRVIEEDRASQQYTIYIYDLNTDTRNGHAHWLYPNRKNVAKPSISISEGGPLAGTKYTASMYNDEFIEVLGKAKKVDGVPRHIEIDYEQ